GITVGILPYGKESANEYVDIAIPTYYGLARNHLVVRASDVLIAIDGAVGTLSEISFALNEGKTVIALHSWTLDEKKLNNGRYLHATSPEEAVALAVRALNA
ncbi:MAG: TIGR00725 family protein, partial [Euryarchaeota archaeon]|nr:TIGR00725 family protein [Euryarchaeota archaeon]